jgi:hypothetical protein
MWIVEFQFCIINLFQISLFETEMVTK